MAVFPFNETLFFVIVAVFLLPFHISNESHIHSKFDYSRHGDFTIVGLFDEIHIGGCENAAGGSALVLGTLHKIEAMVFALEKVNNMSGILPNITLGFAIHGTCGKKTLALDHVISELFRNMLPQQRETVSEISDVSEVSDIKESYSSTVGILGASWSSISTDVSRIYSVFHRPCLSYLSTSDELSDSEEFPYFLRVVPPDRYQIQAIIDILFHFEWSSVSFVYTDDSYGRNALKFFKKQTEEHRDNGSLCIAGEFGVDSNSAQEDYDNILKTIEEYDHSRVVILFVHLTYANMFLQAAMNRTDAKDLQLIGGDAWGENLDGLGYQLAPASGALKIRFVDEPVLEFEDYLFRKSPTNGNPWLDADVMERNRALKRGFSKESAVSRVMDSVLVYAYGLDALLRQKCPTYDPLCVELYKNNFNGTELLQSMKKLNFRGYNRYDVFFDSNGDEIGIYDIVNIQCVKDEQGLVSVKDCQLLEVGNWSAKSKLNINDTSITWGLSEDASSGPVASYCVGPQTYIQWADPWAVIIVILNCIALLCTILVAIGYAMNIKHKLLRASGPEINCIVLAGVFVSYIVVFSLLAKPSTVTCYFVRIGYMLCFTTLNAPLLVHARAIFSRYRAVVRCTKRPDWSTSGFEKVFLSLGLILIQVTITIVFLIKTPPEPVDIEPVPRQRELTCNKDNVELAVSLTYNVLLIVLCTIHAFLTRQVPENFSESRFIGFSAYTTLVIWIFFIPSYVITPYSTLKVVFLSAALIISSGVSLIFLFMVKIYAVYYGKDLKISRRPKAAQISWPASEQRNTQNVQSGPYAVSMMLALNNRQVPDDTSQRLRHNRSYDCQDTAGSTASGYPIITSVVIVPTLHPHPSLTSDAEPYPSTLWL